eukprot:CAMPEP_0117084404 /NCGR_PEP_ID=MMETSP0472-20121206/59398_1 /TAXON_ID=693140 ORGANISM="Tiarina fusus, Strain LIS" /NCGR_SAMPLE_ID=MMETSP0472 /ASSEMBLY_ACC=CAM_ASM_000603 /LENGTH=49 /DNA_ID= /DNA_START= /DNA_END= /DNA_ORIENTATION=
MSKFLVGGKSLLGRGISPHNPHQLMRESGALVEDIDKVTALLKEIRGNI